MLGSILQRQYLREPSDVTRLRLILFVASYRKLHPRQSRQSAGTFSTTVRITSVGGSESVEESLGR